MNRLLSSILIKSVFVVSFAFVGTVSAADTYDVMAECSVSHYTVQDKCGLSIHLGEDYVSKILLKKVIFKINGKPVYIGYNDKTPLVAGNTFSLFSLGNSIPVTCGKTYNVTAHVVKATSSLETKVGDPQPVTCPTKANF